MKPVHHAVLNRWQKGQSSSEISDALKLAGGEAARTIVLRARKRGDPRATIRDGRIFGPNLRAHAIYPMSCAIGAKLHLEAERRGVGVNELVDRLIRVVVSDDLFASILDDGKAAA